MRSERQCMHRVIVPEQGMKATTASSMDARRRQAAAVVVPPRFRGIMLGIKIENVETRDSAGRHADKRAGILLPNLAQFFRIGRGGLETAVACRALVGQTRKARHAGSG